jgi:hypothetical protein
MPPGGVGRTWGGGVGAPGRGGGPVGHRPRVRGQSKYGLHNRLWVGIVDLFGVMWLNSRYTPGLEVSEE